MKTHREIIFERIEQALNEGRLGGYLPAESPIPELPPHLVRQLAPEATVELVARFKQQLASLRDHCLEFSTIDEARAWLIQEIAARGYSAGAIDHDAADYLALDEAQLANVALVRPGDRAGLLRATFGISLIDCGIAYTGTLVARGDAKRSRLTSLAPDVHYAILELKNLLPDLVDALARHRHGAPAANWTWITGSSRTADIDGILIRGAHGPRELIVLLIGGPAA